MIGSISQGTGNNLFGMLRSLQKEQEEVLPTSDATPQNLAIQTQESLDAFPSSVSASSPNLMSRNFASAEKEESRYIQAMLIGMKANDEMKDQQQNALTSILQTAKAEYESASSSGERYAVLKRAEKKIFWHQNNEVVKSAEETHLKATKEDLEEKAQEAAAPKDANGNPIESLPIEGNEGSPPTPAPEVAASNPEPAADAVLPSAPEMATPTPAVVTPSINIIV